MVSIVCTHHAVIAYHHETVVTTMTYVLNLNRVAHNYMYYGFNVCTHHAVIAYHHEKGCNRNDVRIKFESIKELPITTCITVSMYVHTMQ